MLFAQGANQAHVPVTDQAKPMSVNRQRQSTQTIPSRTIIRYILHVSTVCDHFLPIRAECRLIVHNCQNNCLIDFAFDTAAAVYGGIIAVDENQWSHVIQQHECTKLTHVQTACAG